jgi:hypothetical protein
MNREEFSDDAGRLDSHFCGAVAAIDAGDLASLERQGKRR